MKRLLLGLIAALWLHGGMAVAEETKAGDDPAGATVTQELAAQIFLEQFLIAVQAKDVSTIKRLLTDHPDTARQVQAFLTEEGKGDGEKAQQARQLAEILVKTQALAAQTFLEQLLSAVQAKDVSTIKRLLTDHPDTARQVQASLTEEGKGDGEKAQQARQISELLAQMIGIASKKSDQDPRLAEMQRLLGQGNAANARADYPAALAAWEQGLDIARAAGNQQAIGTFLTNLGAVYQAHAQYPKALEYWRQALAIDRALGDRKGESANLTNLGVIYLSLGQYPEALEHFQKALAIDREIGDKKGIGINLSNLGIVYDDLGLYPKALDHYQQALTLRREIGDRMGEGDDLTNLGVVYQNLGQYPKALDHFQQALAIHRDIGDRKGEGNDLDNIATVYLNLGQYPKALDHCQQALVIHRGIGDRKGEGADLSNLGVVYRNLGQYPEALEHYQQALAISHEIGDRAGEVLVLHNLAEIHRTQQDYPAARERFKQAMLVETEMGAPERLWRIWNGLQDTFAALDHPEAAIFAGKQAVNTLQAMRADMTSLEQALQKSFISDKEFVYKDLADLLIGQGRLPEAQQVLAMLKQEELFDYIRRRTEEGDPRDTRVLCNRAEQPWCERWEAIQGRLTGLGLECAALRKKAGDRTPEEQQRYEALEADLKLARQAYNDFWGEMLADLARGGRGAEVLTAELEEKLATFQGMLAELGEGVVALHYLVTDDRLRIILTTPEVQVAREAAIGAAELSRQIAAWRQALERREDPLPLAQALYRVVLGPVAEDLRQAHARTLMVALEDVLRYLPVAALHDGNHYVAQNYAVAVYTLAHTSSYALAPTSGKAWKVAGFGVSRPHEGFSPLEAVPDELKGIVRRTGDDQDRTGVLPGFVALDDDFTYRRFRDALDAAYPVLHIASHFKFQPGQVQDSFLLLGDGDHLTLDRIQEDHLRFSPVELLTLSACDTATGEITAPPGRRGGVKGAEIESFGALAQQRGAKGVLATLWSVADRSTGLFMRELYRLRSEEGLTKADALRQVQLAFIEGRIGGSGEALPAAPDQADRSKVLRPESQESADPGYSHPYYWAPFILMGNWL